MAQCGACTVQLNSNAIRSCTMPVSAVGAATTHETHFTDGKAVETNFHQYHMRRITDVPDIEVYIMENEEKPGGGVMRSSI